MDFIDKIRGLQSHAREQVKLIKMDNAPKEEDTKIALIQPFINDILGYNTNDLKEVKTEFSIDTKGLRIDYAIFKDSMPIILIECKSCIAALDKKDINQLRTYYPNIKGAESKFGILTNGIHYQFYTDIKDKNILDEDPFFEFDLFNLKDSAILELTNFIKSADIDNARIRADQLKKQKDVQAIIENLFESPSEDFAKFIAKKAQVSFVGDKVVKEYTKLTTDAINEYISERMRIKWEQVSGLVPKKETTKEELESYFIIKTLLADVADSDHIIAKESEKSLDIFYEDGSSQKIICRLYLNDGTKYLGLFDANGNETKTSIESIDDINRYSDQIVSLIKPNGEKSFIFQGQTYKIELWKEMLPTVCVIMAKRHKNDFEKILDLKGHKHNYFSKNQYEFKYGEKIEGTDIYVNTNVSPWDHLNRSKKVIAKFGYSKDDIKLIK